MHDWLNQLGELFWISSTAIKRKIEYLISLISLDWLKVNKKENIIPDWPNHLGLAES